MTRSLQPARTWLLGLALALVALVGVACAPVGTPVAQPSPAGNATAPSVAPTQAVSTPVPVATTAPVDTADIAVGVDADGNFYRGDPNAPVKLVEYSDFQ